MPESFDPYHRWLGIPPREQPPNHYRLLGIDLFEADADVIDLAADRQMSHVRTFQTGEHSAESQVVLNQIAAARITLLNSAKRVAYDEKLKAVLQKHKAKVKKAQPLKTAEVIAVPVTGPAKPPAPPKTAAVPTPVAAPTPVEVPPQAPSPDGFSAPRLGTGSSTYRRPKSSLPTPAIFAAIGAVSFIVAALVFVFARPDRSEVARQQPEPPPAAAPVAKRPARPKPEKTQYAAEKIPGLDGKQTGDGRPAGENKDTTARAQSIDLLKFVSLQRDAVEGKWRCDGKSLIASAGKSARLELPCEPPEEYELRIEIERASGFRPGVEVPGHGALVLGLCGPGGRFIAGLDWHRSTHGDYALLGAFDGELVEGNPTLKRISLGDPVIKAGQVNIVVVTVRKTGVTATINGQQVIDWKGDLRRLSVPEDWATPHRQRPFLGAQACAFRITGLKIAPFAGGDPLVVIQEHPTDPDSGPDSDLEPAPESEPELGTQPPLPETGQGRLADLMGGAGLPPQQRETPFEEKTPLPDDAQRQKAEKDIRDIFSKEYAAASTPDAKKQLAEMLVQQASQAADEKAVRYVLYCQALRWAGEAGEVMLARQVCGQLINEYQVDPWKVCADSLLALSRSVREKNDRENVGRSALKIVSPALAEDRYEVASQMVELGLGIAVKLRMSDLRRQAVGLQRSVKLAEKRWKEFQPAFQILEKTPDDPDANLTVGRYFCFVKGEWPQGLEHLAKAGDATIKKLADDDRAGPAEAAAQAAVGDSWWSLADTLGESEQLIARGRACHWYSKAVAGVSGLSKVRLQKRIEEYEESARQAGAGERSVPQRSVPGMAGRIKINGRDHGLILRYMPGTHFRDKTLTTLVGPPTEKRRVSSSSRSSSRSSSYKTYPRRRDILLLGALVVPRQMQVSIRQQGGSSGGVARLYLGGKLLGSVDGKKTSAAYDLSLLPGNHTISWMISGGAIGDCMLEFTDPKTAQPLKVVCTKEITSQVQDAPTRATVSVSTQ